MHAVTTDISLGGIGMMASSPLPMGRSLTLYFDILLDGKRHEVNLGGHVTYCVLSGTDGYRTGLRIVTGDPASIAVIRGLLVS